MREPLAKMTKLLINQVSNAICEHRAHEITSSSLQIQECNRSLGALTDPSLHNVKFLWGIQGSNEEGEFLCTENESFGCSMRETGSRKRGHCKKETNYEGEKQAAAM